jgi:16S rRNA (adenine1518-N6/adenine1519-N6)-dimethyltransferase
MCPAPLGQNFLASADWRERIAGMLNIRAGDVWLEIGAGHGEMTELLAARAARVVAIELDAQLAAGLRKRAAAWPNVEIVESDVLRADLATLAASEKFRVYGNIPYYITSPILHRIFALDRHPESAHLVMQLEVAERLVSAPGHREYGYLSVATQFYSRPEILTKIPPGAFRPPPKVSSALVALCFPGANKDLAVVDPAAFLEFVQACFAQKRKTLANNLRGRPSTRKTQKKGGPKNESEDPLQKLLLGAGIPAKARAEQLTIPQFVALYDAFASLT